MTAQIASLPIHQRALLNEQDFLLLNDSGAFDGYRKTELIDGEIYYMNSQYRRHAMVKTDVYDAIRDRLRASGSSLRVVQEASVGIGPHDMPEPDVFLTSQPYGAGVFPGDSIALIIEVADSTQAMDLGKKLEIYARAAVPEYWVLDTQACIAHQHWQPEGTAYAQRREIAFGQAITAVTLPDLTVTLPD